MQSAVGLGVLVEAAYELGVQHSADPTGSTCWCDQIANGSLGYDWVVVQIIGSDEADAQAQAGQ
jgi:hypothetical protein